MSEKNQVRRIRESQGLSQEKLARVLGMSTASIRAYERGARPGPSVLAKLKLLENQDTSPAPVHPSVEQMHRTLDVVLQNCLPETIEILKVALDAAAAAGLQRKTSPL